MLSGLSGYIKNVKNAIHSNISHNQQQKPSLGRIRIGNRDIEEINLISQGGYAYVFKVRDVQTGELFALKKMICQSPERLQTAKNEINMLRSLPNHPNLLEVYDTHVERVENSYYVYVLLELCAEGSLFDLMAKYESSKLSEKQMIFIMREICEGVKVLHSMKPPVAHRDLKIENVLMNNKKFKLCDFGSCSTSVVDFSKIPQSQYSNYEEEYDKNTTLMYRPPEMCDPFLRQIVSAKVDVWMLGCILYTMCFYKHPFQESTKLSIVNAAYTFPSDHPYPDKLIDLIRIMLTPNPQARPSIYDICELLNNYFNISSVQLNPDALRVKNEQKKQAAEMSKFESSNNRKFKGDIPIEELMKLQKQVRGNDDESPVNSYSEPSAHYKPKVTRHANSGSKLVQPSAFDDFGSFGSGPRKSNAPELHHFNSSPSLPSNDWYNFGGNSSEGESKPNRNAQRAPQSSFAQFAQTNNNQAAQPNTKVNDQWQNFDFNTVSSTPKTNTNPNTNINNNTSNNGGNNWATAGWGPSTQAQPVNNNRPQQVQGNMSQNGPNLWGAPNQGQPVNNMGGQFNSGPNNWGMQNQMQTPNNRMGPMQGNMNQMPNQNAGNWGMQNQMQMQQPQNNNNRMGQPQGNVGQNNNFGGFSNNSQPVANNNAGGQNQSGGTTITNDLLDLADTSSKKDASSSIMALYSMKV